MPLQEGDHVRLQCEDCFRPLGRFVLFHHQGEGPLLLADAAEKIRCGNPSEYERHRGYGGHRKGRVWAADWDRGEGIRYRYECRCGRTILLATARVERLARGSRIAAGRDAVFLV